MKAMLLLCLVTCACMAQGEYSEKFIKAMRNGADTSVEIRICDDDGSPVSNATVHVCYNVGSGRSEEFLETDSNGKCLFTRKTNGYGEIYVNKEGFYDSESMFSFIDMGNEHDVKDGVWQPAPLKVCIGLRKIKNPIEMKHSSKEMIVPLTNTWIGFDFVQKDWAKPFGEGAIADIKMLLEWDGRMQWQYTDMKLKLDFQGDNMYLVKLNLCSAMPYVYKADPSRFDTKELTYYRVGRKPRLKKEFEKGSELVVRCRCHTNDVDGCVYYNYAGIVNVEFAVDNQGRPVVRMPYYFNPTPNDTNLEPKR